MGQDSSSPIDESTPPQMLRDRSIESVAQYIKEGRAKKIVVMVSRFVDGGLDHLLTIVDDRSEQASAPLPEYQTFVRQTRGCMPTWLACIFHIQKQSSTSRSSDKIHSLFTPSPMNYTLANLGLPFHMLSFACSTTKAFCSNCSLRILSVLTEKQVCQAIRSLKPTAASLVTGALIANRNILRI